MATRDDIDPGVLRSHLAAISIIEIEADGVARFRIAGSEVRSVFGQEMRGRRLDEFRNEAADMWSLGLTAVLERRAPVGGIIQRADDRHAWLRLPLASRRGDCLILCHDMIMMKPSKLGHTESQSSIKSHSTHVLAA